MGLLRVLGRAGGVGVLTCAAALASGCQIGPSVATEKLAQHQQAVDKDGLKNIQVVPELRVTAAPPADWVTLPAYKAALYTHMQWRSPTKATGVGVIYARLPVPLSVNMLLWFAKQEYTKKQSDGRLIGQWTDSFGRSWFEAENNKYHVRGYAVVQGTDAWFVYSGYRMTMEQRPEEIAVAARCQETILIQTKGEMAASAGAQADVRN